MAPMQEVLATVGLFSLFLIVIPVSVFTLDLVKSYLKSKNKEEKS